MFTPPSSTDETFSNVGHDDSMCFQLRKTGYVYGGADSHISPVPFPSDSLHVLFNDVTLTSENT
jgi:hypothetical protein